MGAQLVTDGRLDHQEVDQAADVTLHTERRILKIHGCEERHVDFPALDVHARPELPEPPATGFILHLKAKGLGAEAIHDVGGHFTVEDAESRLLSNVLFLKVYSESAEFEDEFSVPRRLGWAIPKFVLFVKTQF